MTDRDSERHARKDLEGQVPVEGALSLQLSRPGQGHRVSLVESGGYASTSARLISQEGDAVGEQFVHREGAWQQSLLVAGLQNHFQGAAHGVDAVGEGAEPLAELPK